LVAEPRTIVIPDEKEIEEKIFINKKRTF